MKLATGTMPVVSAQACGPPSSSIRVAACGAERLSFQSRASRTGVPVSSTQHHAVLLAADGERLDAVEEARGRLLPGLPPDPCVDLRQVGVRRTSLAHDLAGPVSHTTTLVLWVEQSTPATRVTRARLPVRAPRQDGVRRLPP